MKNIMKLLIGVLVISTVLISCKKDDDEKEAKNFLKIGDTEYDLSAGILENYGASDIDGWYRGYNTDLTLYSKGLTIQLEDNDFDLLGKGHGIFFEMFSTDGNVLDNTEYTFTSVDPCPIGTFDDGAYIINYNSETEDNEYEGEIVSGKVAVSVKEGEYKITINCIGKSGIKITGFYKGTLRYFDSSGGRRSASIESTKIKEKLFK